MHTYRDAGTERTWKVLLVQLGSFPHQTCAECERELRCAGFNVYLRLVLINCSRYTRLIGKGAICQILPMGVPLLAILPVLQELGGIRVYAREPRIN